MADLVGKAEQPLEGSRNHRCCPADLRTGNSPDPPNMATFKDPTRCFAPLEVVERLLEIRSELGFGETIYLERCQELTDFLDAYGFDIYAFATTNEKINYGDYRTPVVPGGERLHASLMAH